MKHNPKRRDKVKQIKEDVDDSKYEMLRIHVNMLQNQIATISLSIASIEAQMKKIENSIPLVKEDVPTVIPLDVANVTNDLNVDDDESTTSDRNDSDGYDTDDSPIQTHRVKTRSLKSPRQRFVFVPNYVDAQTNEESCDDSSYESD